MYCQIQLWHHDWCALIAPGFFSSCYKQKLLDWYTILLDTQSFGIVDDDRDL